MALSRICRCWSCEVEVLTDRQVLPDGWMIEWFHSVTLCADCIASYKNKFGKEPEYYIKQGESQEICLI